MLPNRTSAAAGLDALRVGAVLLVTTQHALTLTGYEERATLAAVNAGQLGVAIFLGISAYLGALSPRPPVSWLFRRLLRLYPSYWVVIISSFILVWMTQYKVTDGYQFASQMAGIGLFTHGINLVNVPTWFISILLVCYAGLFVARLARQPLALSVLVVAGTAVAIAWFEVPEWPWMHLVTFFLTAALARACPPERRALYFLAAGLLVLCGAWLVPAFAYTGITLLLIGALARVAKGPRVLHLVAEYSYEYYLVHGAFLVLLVRVLSARPVLAIAGAIVLAAFAAYFLRTSMDEGLDWLARRFRPVRRAVLLASVTGRGVRKGTQERVGS